MNRIVSIVVGVGVIATVGGFVYFQTQVNRGNMAVPQNTDTSSGITLEEVATHADGTSCWAAINGNVYDLTSWIPQHPGGSKAILQLCGKDGSEKFNAVHGGKEPMETVLAGFKIGELAK